MVWLVVEAEWERESPLSSVLRMVLLSVLLASIFSSLMTQCNRHFLLFKLLSSGKYCGEIHVLMPIIECTGVISADVFHHMFFFFFTKGMRHGHRITLEPMAHARMPQVCRDHFLDKKSLSAIQALRVSL